MRSQWYIGADGHYQRRDSDDESAASAVATTLSASPADGDWEGIAEENERGKSIVSQMQT